MRVLHEYYRIEEWVVVLTAFSASSADSYSTKACNYINMSFILVHYKQLTLDKEIFLKLKNA